MSSTRSTRRSNVRHYSMFDKKTLCGLVAMPSEDMLTSSTNCKKCLKEAISAHFQLSNFAAMLLKDTKQ